MKLKDWDWERQEFVEIDYPDEPIREFVNWLRTTKQWYQSPDPGRDVYTRYRRLQEQLAPHRDEIMAERRKEAETHKKRLRALAKARRVKAQKAKERKEKKEAVEAAT